jgi:hypothetical protein
MVAGAEITGAAFEILATTFLAKVDTAFAAAAGRLTIGASKSALRTLG